MLKEIASSSVPFFYQATLSNGTVIYVKDNGKAIDFNGNTYTALFKEDENGDIEVEGWLKD